MKKSNKMRELLNKGSEKKFEKVSIHIATVEADTIEQAEVKVEEIIDKIVEDLKSEEEKESVLSKIKKKIVKKKS